MTPTQLAAPLAAQAAVGAAGERIALRFERERLAIAGVKYPARCVKQLSASNVAAGYDVHSESPEGGTRCIEVKATVGSADDGFYISANELAAFERFGSDAYLYLVEIQSMPSRGRVVAVVPNPARFLQGEGC